MSRRRPLLPTRLPGLLAALLLVGWSTGALALDSGDALVLALSDGRTVEGWYLRSEPGLVVLSGPQGEIRVPRALVVSAQAQGLPLQLQALDAGQGGGPTGAAPAASLPRPSPGGAVALSLLVPGAGHAAVGDWLAAGGYVLVDGVLWATGVYAVRKQQVGVLLPLIAVDLLLRGCSAGESSRLARRRRGGGRAVAIPGESGTASGSWG